MLCLIAVIPVQAQNTPAFPTVAATGFASFSGDYFAISNNATYIYLCAGADLTCNIYERSTGNVVMELESNAYATWSADGSRLVAAEGILPCESAEDTPNLRLFDPSTGTASTACVPFTFPWLDWSPINTNVFTIDEQTLFNFADNSISSYRSTVTVDATAITRYVGYGGLFWDSTNGAPVGVINLRRDVDPTNDQIVSSVFELCAMRLLQCAPLLDTLAHTTADVYSWTLNGRWLLWAGHLSSSGTAMLTGEDPASYNDTVIFLTNIFNGETQEIFRFSSLGESNLYTTWNMSWSPDRNMIALSLGETASATPVARPTLGPAPEARSMLLITLDWGD
jgi:hypothetical protein